MIPIETTAPEMNDDSIIILPSLRLYVQLNHQRNRDTGDVSLQALGNDTNNYNIMIRQIETISADPLKMSKVDIYEEICVGTMSIQSL